MADIEADIHRLAGQNFNVGSPKQFGEILFETLGMPGGKRKKPARGHGFHRCWRRSPRPGVRSLQRVMDWRQLAKLKSTYADALVGQIDPKTGRVHTSFSMAATTTGRLSSTDPNLQNIPIRTERARGYARRSSPPRGAVWSRRTIPRSNCRLLAHVANIPALKDSFARARTSTRAPPRKCSACRWPGWMRRRGGGRKQSISASFTAFPHSAWAGNWAYRGRGEDLYRRLFQALSGNPRLYGQHEGAGQDRWICAHTLWPALLGAADKG